MKKSKLIAVLLGILVLPSMALADASSTILPTKPSGEYNLCDLLTLVNNGVNIIAKGIVPLVATLLIAWAGFRMVTNQGNTEIATQSKMIFLAVAIGLVVMFAAYAIVGTILMGMGYATSPFNWAPTCQI